MDIELRNDRIPRNPFDRQFLDMSTRSSTVLENSCVGVGKAKLKSNFASSNTLDSFVFFCPCVFRRGYEGDRGQTVGPVLLGP